MMTCFKGMKEVNGKKILVIHGSVTQKEKNMYPIHMDHINHQITFDMDKCDPDTIKKVADILAKSAPAKAKAPAKKEGKK